MARSSVLRSEVTADYIRSILDYNEQTGLFAWKIQSGRSSVGKLAGTPDKGYIKIGFGNKIYCAHRLAWIWKNGSWPTGQIDHINGNTSDNRIKNLRDVDCSGNQQNLQGPKKRKRHRGHLGVTWVESRNKWLAQIGIDGKTYNLGRYKVENEAAAVYQHVKAVLHPCSQVACNNPAKAAASIGESLQGLRDVIASARQMLINRRV